MNHLVMKCSWKLIGIYALILFYPSTNVNPYLEIMNQIKKSLTMSLNLVMMTRMRQTLKYHRVQFNGKLQARLLEKILLKKLLQLKLNKLLLLLLLLLLLKKYQRTRKLSAELVRKPSAVSKYLNSTSNFYT